MDPIYYQEEENPLYEVIVTSDGVSTSGISSPKIVISGKEPVTFDFNECSSSFQSVSSCDTLESYDNQLNTSPKVIVIPGYLADDAVDNQFTGTTTMTNNGHIPKLKGCSIRIDQLKMSSDNYEVNNVANVIELPFSMDSPTEYMNTSSYFFSDGESSAFEGFDAESANGYEYEEFKKAISFMEEDERVENVSRRRSYGRNARKGRYTRKPASKRKPAKPVTERKTPGRKKKQPVEIVEPPQRPQRPTRRTLKLLASLDQIEHPSQSLINNVEVSPPLSLPVTSRRGRKKTVKPVPTPEIITSTQPETVAVVGQEVISDTDSESNVPPAVAVPVPVDNSPNHKKIQTDMQTKERRKERKKMAKIKRKLDLTVITEKIRQHWIETFALAKKEQSRIDRKRMQMKAIPHKSRNNSTEHRSGGKRSRVSYSSDSDSSDSSNSSKTTYSSSSSYSDSNDQYTSDESSYTSSNTRTESDSDHGSESSETYHRGKHRSRRSRSPSTTTDTSDYRGRRRTDTSDSSSSDEPTHKRRKLHHRRHSGSERNFQKSRKRRSWESHRPEESLRTKRKMKRKSDRRQNDSRRTKSRPTYNQNHQNYDFPSTSSSAKGKKFRPNFYKRPRNSSTSAGAFAVNRSF